MVNGVLNIDKPKGITSHDVISRLRKLTGQRRIGHAGTLDPFATGVLVVGLGTATRLLEYTHDLSKTYEATFVLGATSDTDDVTGFITPLSSSQPPLSDIQATLTSFIGTIEQTPPAYSAVKVQGKKLYELARTSAADASAKALERTRIVTIHNIVVTSYKYPRLTLTISCGAGTYIRAIARDMGMRLQVGAYVEELRRTRIGDFVIDAAIPLDSATPESISSALLPIQTIVSHLPEVILTEAQTKDFTQGKKISLSASTDKTVVQVAGPHDSLIGIGTYSASEQFLIPKKVLPVSH